MKCFYKILLFLLLFFSFEYGESIIDSSSYSNHMELFIHQDIINNFLHSIGEIKGKGKMAIIGYNWTVSNANIAINEEKSEFYADVKLEYGDLSRTDLPLSVVALILPNPKDDDIKYEKIKFQVLRVVICGIRRNLGALYGGFAVGAVAIPSLLYLFLKSHPTTGFFLVAVGKWRCGNCSLI